MLSAMTTSENFPIKSQTGCNLTSYESVTQPPFVSSLLRQNLQMMSSDDGVLKYQIIQESGMISPKISYYPKKEGMDFSEACSKESYDSSFSMEVSKTELETDLTDLLEQLDLDDSLYEQSKPLKIDPNVLKLDFSKITMGKDWEALEKLSMTDFSENKRASHHLSGGGLLTDASQNDFRSIDCDSANNQLCRLSRSSVTTTESVFNFNEVDHSSGVVGGSGFLNQISPSSPLTFDLTSENEQHENVTSVVSQDTESTNPFKNLINDFVEDENSFSPTNPFSDFCGQSSLNGIPSIACEVPKYENVKFQKSFSQCSTRPTSPALNTAEESCISNPFLLNKTTTSPEPHRFPVPQFFLTESNLQNPTTPAIQNQSSFIFAVPVFPIFPHNITNSSTQTGETIEVPKPQDPVYQNLTNQIQKFMKTNNHSEYDLQCLKTTLKDLRNSGWYYENVSWQESVVLLKNKEVGTFLIRDSSDPNFLFSLSVQTSRGPTSVRLHYVNGQFRLDAEEKLIPHMPSFNSVIDLIDYYVENTVKNKANNKTQKPRKPGKQNFQKSKDQVWIDSQGNVYSNILLVKPLYKKDHFSTLQHLARLTINTYIKKRLNVKVKFNFKVTPVYESSPFQHSSFQSNFDDFCPALSIDTLPLPSKLIDFVKEYPYCH